MGSGDQHSFQIACIQALKGRQARCSCIRAKNPPQAFTAEFIGKVRMSVLLLKHTELSFYYFLYY